jgi:hypothetical protein
LGDLGSFEMKRDPSAFREKQAEKACLFLNGNEMSKHKQELKLTT